MKLNQIAQSLDVSPACISIVRQGHPGVSAKVRRKIQLLLEENGYTYKPYREPSQTMEDTLSKVRQGYIRLVKYRKSTFLTDKNEGFVDAIIDSIDARARLEGYTLVLSAVSHQEYDDFLLEIPAESCAGLMVIATEMDREDILKLSGLSVPIVILDSDHPSLPFCTVTMNNRDLAYDAVQKLNSYRDGEIGHLSSGIRTGNFIGRENGFQEALRDLGLPLREENIFSLTPSLSGAYAEMLSLLDAGRKLPRNLFADNDVIAIGAMRAMQERGYTLPGDVRLIGVDNTTLSQIVSPSLSTMQISLATLGQQALSTLLFFIAHPESAPIHIRLSSHPVFRETAP